MKSEYACKLRINLRELKNIIIDQHYKKKHPELNDMLIIKLVEIINGMNFTSSQENTDFEYFKVEPIFYQDKPYRLVFLLPKIGNYIGIINAFRVRSKK